MIVWFTGQPGSGKTTLAAALLPSFLIDGDYLRTVLPNPGYGEEGRRRNIDRAQAIAAYLDQPDRLIAVALVSPYRDQREEFKSHRNVLEVYLWTSEIRGREKYHVLDYEPPEENYLGIDTGRNDVRQALRIIHREMATSSPWT